MVQVFIDGVGSEALIAALKLLYYGECELRDVSEDKVKEAANVLGFLPSKDDSASRASLLAFHQDSPPQADPWGSGGEASGGGLYPNLAGAGGGDPWAAQPQQASTSPAPVDPFSPGSPVKTSGGADLLAADWSSGGAANGNGGALGGGGCPSIAPQVQFHIQSFLLLIFCKSFVFQVAANHWDLSGLDPMAGSAGPTGARPKTGVESLLGEHSNLVNLDNLTQVNYTPPLRF